MKTGWGGRMLRERLAGCRKSPGGRRHHPDQERSLILQRWQRERAMCHLIGEI